MGETLRDRRGNLLGEVRHSGGRHERRDARGVIKGTYDERTGQTRDARGNIVGDGNPLCSLLER